MEATRKPVGEWLDAVPRQAKIKRSAYQESGRYPIVDQSQADIAGYTDDESWLYQGELPVVIFGDHTRVLKFVNFPFCVGADGTQLLRPVAGNDIRYFYYALRNVGLTNYGYERHFKYLKEEEIPAPPLPVQRRIAGILSAYDELMENSQRRIRLLEAMARALYREWFVHFRFPGHEKHPRVASPLGDIPQGWEVLEFRHLFDIRYGKTLPKTEISDSGPYPVYGAGDVIGFYDKMLNPNKCALVTSRGNGSGTVWRTREAAFVTNNSLIMLPQEDRRYWDYSFVELLLKHANVMEAKTGSAQPQVTIENLNYVKAIVPTKLLVERFCAIATPIYEQVDCLFRQIQYLRRTRDLLLPRLLSGRVQIPITN